MGFIKRLFFHRSKASRQKCGSGKPPYIDRRRARRTQAVTPVFIYGHTQEGPFTQRTETANVSALGGLLSLSVKVARLQRLVVTNLQTNEDRVCRVVRFSKGEHGQALVGVEFLQSSPQFWPVESET
jgi:c-di-GMP-binding flagellar brake protein YcgR